MPSLPRPSESQEQASFVYEVLLAYRNRADFLRPLFFSTLSGAWIAGSNSRAKVALIAKYKREGWVNGVSDVLYLQPRGKYAYLAIEMKSVTRANEKHGGASDDQLTWLKAAKEAGAMTAVCHGADAAMEVFRLYMAMDIQTPADSE